VLFVQNVLIKNEETIRFFTQKSQIYMCKGVNMKKIFLKEFSKILASHTRKNLDSLQWRKILRVLSETIGEELAKGNRIYLPCGEYYVAENTQETVKNSIDGQSDIPVKNKYRAVCSCSRHYKEIINSDTRK